MHMTTDDEPVIFANRIGLFDRLFLGGSRNEKAEFTLRYLRSSGR